MNILTDRIPNELIICEKICPINTDFRIWIKVSQIIYSKQLNVENMLDMLKLIFADTSTKLPPNFYEALQAISNFLNPPKRETQAMSEEKQNRAVYDFEYDADYIYSAFFQQYGIDLCTANLHWWQFKALFEGLSDDTQFSKIVGYRAIDLNDIKDKEMKKQYRKLKKLYKLPDNRTQEEKEADFSESISELF